MERVEVLGANTFVLLTKQLGPNCWCCDMYEHHDNTQDDSFVLEDFGESEIEAIAMAMSDAHDPSICEGTSRGYSRAFLRALRTRHEH